MFGVRNTIELWPSLVSSLCCYFAHFNRISTLFSAAAIAAATAFQTTIARFKAQLCTVISRI